MSAPPNANIRKLDRNRFSPHMPSLLSLPAALLGLLLGGCVISTPFRGPGFADGKVTQAAPDTEVVVSITNATVNRDQRGPFDEHVSKVVKSLPGQPGLIGYAVRKELFGDEVWTITVWRSEADRARFVASNEHRAAMAAGGPALKTVRFSRVVVPAQELPLSWERAKVLLDAQPRSY
ncbi:MAG: antibiotic biosynthesis monooxygenase family protein [Burkholderiales bacterium]|nr:antibiotic biosynthesis monooxygenase family protein [Burkholderiales bacterium]